MPGWTSALPLQRLLVEYADMHPNRSDRQMHGATEFVAQLEAAQAGYIIQNPSLKARTGSLKTANKNYLVHEYLHKHWQPLFHADVARDLADAKMTFAGSAELPFAYDVLYLNEERRALMEKISNPEMRETLKDYFLNTSFRKDVFVRGPLRISGVRQAELLARVGLALTVSRSKALLKIKLPFGDVNCRADLYEPVLDALAVRPHTLAELAKLPAHAGQGMQNLAQIATLLCASNQAEFFFPADAGSSANADAAHRLNATLAAQTRYGDESSALCSPLLGSAIAANYIERLFYLTMLQRQSEHTPATLAHYAWQVMAPLGRRMRREDVTLQSEQDNLDELALKAEEFLKDKLPIWRQLQIL
jgi:hypothetical protein